LRSVVSINFADFKRAVARHSHNVTTSPNQIMEGQRLQRKDVSYVVGADGNPLTPSDLPPVNTKRWVSSRKALVVQAVESGLLSLDDACSRYMLTIDEFLGWQAAIQTFGPPALRATRVQVYRRSRNNSGH
jgi:hypothetical protein